MSDAGSSVPDASSTINVRASGRVRKQPEHFASSPFGNAKRKRGQEGDEDGDVDLLEDGEDEDDEDDEDDPEDEPDEEELRAKKRANRTKKSTQKKVAPKKSAAAQTNGLELPIRGATKKASAKKRPPKKKAKIADTQDAEAAGGLYADLFARDRNADEAVADWLKAYEKDQSKSLADVVNFVLKCAGAVTKLSDHDIEDPDGATNRLSDIQDEYTATNPSDYPLIVKAKGAASFKQTICHLMRIWTKAIAAKDLLDSDPLLLENTHVWLSTMSSAANRSFRHTSTVISLSIMTALCEVAREYVEKAATLRRQAESERKKKTVNKERVKQITDKAAAANKSFSTLEALLKDWFETIFIHRYRDVEPLIRKDCMEALGDWIMALPDLFFDGTHMRYIGWVLADHHTSVRAEAVKQLRRLYADSNKLGGLKTFTERFRSRIVEMGTSDADVSVRILALELLHVLRGNDLLEPDDIDAIGRLVFHEDVKVRKAVASFFAENVTDLYNSKLDELGGEGSLKESLPTFAEDDFDAPRLSWLKYKSLAEMLQSYDQDDPGSSQFERNIHDGSLTLVVAGADSRFTLAVDALYDKLDDLAEWRALAGYLLYDAKASRPKKGADAALTQLKKECSLEEREELILLEVLNAAVKRSLSDLAAEVNPTHRKITKKQKEELAEELDDAVRSLADLVPKLLKKYGDTPGTASAVLRLGGVFSLPALRNLRQDPDVNGALLDDLRAQFMSHGTDEVLGPATAAILHAQGYGELDESALDKVSALWDDVIGNLAELLNIKTVGVRGASPSEELVALSNNLLRIARLSAVSNPTSALEDSSVKASDKSTGKEYWGAIDFIIDLVQRAQHSSGPVPAPEDAEQEDVVAARAAEAGLFYFRWKVSTLMQAIKTGLNSELAYDKLEALAERRDTYVTRLMDVLDGRKPNEQVCFTMTNCLLDLYTSSAVLRTVVAKDGVSDDYTVLILDLDSEHAKSILKVFAALEKDFAKLSGKALEDVVTEDADVDIDAEPIDADELSDSEDDDGALQTQASQQARDAKLMKPLLAERKLMVLTSKIVQAVTAGVLEDASVKKRLERNKSKLGHNYKEILNFLDGSRLEKKAGTRSKTKAKATTSNGAAKKGKANPKSNAIVAEDEIDDEIEDDDAEAVREEEEGDEIILRSAAAEAQSVNGE